MKLILGLLFPIVLIIVLLAPSVYAAPPTLRWSDAVGTLDIALSKDGNYVAVVSPGLTSEIRFYSRNSGTPIWVSTAPSGTDVRSVSISADGDCVVVGSKLSIGGGNVALWKNARSLTGNPTPTWVSVNVGGQINPRCLDISDDGNFVVACGSGSAVFYWANARGRSTTSESPTWQKDFGALVENIDLSSDGNYVAAGTLVSSGHSNVMYWKNAATLAGNPDPDWTSTQPTDDILDIAISDDGNYVAAAGALGPSPVYYWANAKSLSGDPTTTWDGAAGIDFTSIDMSSDGDSVIAGALGPTPGVYFWGGAKGLSGAVNPTWNFTTANIVEDVAIDTAGDYMAAVNDVAVSKVYFFDKSGSLLWNPPFQLDNPATFISISGDGGTLAVGTVSFSTSYLLSTGFSTPTSRTVGGIVTPTNKFEILAPYIALAGLVIAVSTVIVVKKRRD
jgi:WD40 repeat protein